MMTKIDTQLLIQNPQLRGTKQDNSIIKTLSLCNFNKICVKWMRKRKSEQFRVYSYHLRNLILAMDHNKTEKRNLTRN